MKINLCCFGLDKCGLFVHTTDVVATKYKVLFFTSSIYTPSSYLQKLFVKNSDF